MDKTKKFEKKIKLLKEQYSLLCKKIASAEQKSIFFSEKEYKKRTKLLQKIDGKLRSRELSSKKKIIKREKIRFPFKYGVIKFSLPDGTGFICKSKKKNEQIYKKVKKKEGFFAHVSDISGPAIFFISQNISQTSKQTICDLASIYSKNWRYGRKGVVSFIRLKDVIQIKPGLFTFLNKPELVLQKESSFSFSIAEFAVSLFGPIKLIPGSEKRIITLKKFCDKYRVDISKLDAFLPSGSIKILSMPELASGS